VVYWIARHSTANYTNVNPSDSIHHFITKMSKSVVATAWQIVQETALDHSDIYKLLHSVGPQLFTSRSIS
jgi:hypothetical protein